MIKYKNIYSTSVRNDNQKIIHSNLTKWYSQLIDQNNWLLSGQTGYPVSHISPWKSSILYCKHQDPKKYSPSDGFPIRNHLMDGEHPPGSQSVWVSVVCLWLENVKIPKDFHIEVGSLTRWTVSGGPRGLKCVVIFSSFLTWKYQDVKKLS